MGKEHVEGAADNVKGKAKEVAGKVGNNKALQHDEKADQIQGSIHNAVGDAKDACKEAIHNDHNEPRSIKPDCLEKPLSKKINGFSQRLN